MRIMAIDARHFVFRNLVPERFCKLGFHVEVAARAESINLGRRSGHQARRTVSMHGVTSYARDTVFHVAALDALRLF